MKKSSYLRRLKQGILSHPPHPERGMMSSRPGPAVWQNMQPMNAIAA